MNIDKQELIKTLCGKAKPTAKNAAERLGYTHRNNIQRLSDPLTKRQCETITMRMKAKRIAIPKDWNKQNASPEAGSP
jgi:hypothetical protein